MPSLFVRSAFLNSPRSSSDYSRSAAFLANILEKYSYENRPDVRAGWLPLAFHEAGVPWEAIFLVFDELFTTKVC